MLPLIETQTRHMLPYSPTNVIPITNGKNCFETKLFHHVIRSNISIGLPISCISSTTQLKAMKQLGDISKPDSMQYYEVAPFVQSGLDPNVVTQELSNIEC